MEQFYKVVRDDYSSFHDPTFAYTVGETVRRRETGTPELCSSTVLHASRRPEQAVGYGSWPMRLLTVEGIPVVEESDKAGFRQLRVTGEVDVALCFGPVGDRVVGLLRQYESMTAEQARRLAAAGVAAGVAAWGAARYAAGYAAWYAARYASRVAAVSDLVGQHGLTQQHVETLMAPHVAVFGRPEWMETL